MSKLSKQSGSERQPSKSHGAAPPHHSVQKDNKQGQTGRIHVQNIITGSSTLGLTTVLDEFGYGFPSDGLSVASNKWWGSIKPGVPEEKTVDGARVDSDGKNGKNDSDAMAEDTTNTTIVVDDKPESEDENANVELQATGLLVSLRKKACEEGRESLKLGVFRGHRVHRLDQKEKMHLVGMFGSSLPKEWIDDRSN